MAEKKKWLEVELPLLRKTIYLLATELSDINGKTVKIDLTRALKGKSLEIKFKIKVEKDKAYGIPYSANLLGFYIRRMIRKGTNYVESSFKTNCQDAELEVKPFLITRKEVSRRVRHALRKRSIEFISDYVKNKEAEEILSLIISNSLQKNISLKLKKTYPLALCEIRVLNILSYKVEEKEEKKTEKKVEEAKEEKKEAVVPEKKKEEKKKSEPKEKKTEKKEEKTEDKTETTE